MNIDIRPRRCGKSLRMVQMSAAEHTPIVCPTKADANRLMDLAKAKDLHMPQPICLADLESGAIRGLGIRDALVDDADRLLAMLLKTQGIKMATWTDADNPFMETADIDRTKASWNFDQFKREYLGDFNKRPTDEMKCGKCNVEMSMRISRDAKTVTFVCPKCLSKEVRPLECL